ncbi:uncharacterized protein LOC108932842 [Scleropages formosus]|uniref:uncharacterized protein LOC108932842 n=1 Tax=Scleropages formosus TaxID=113540 RepID=UPI0008789964|nr:uncharacterized protein LOC108932842 [Scleropages formosus]
MNGHVLSRRALYTRHFESNFTGRWMSAHSSCGYTITLMAYSSKAPAHVLVLLKNLNFQRATGQFCDCVIRLQLNPEKLYLAHRNILAASSPVLASLLSSQGTLLDLQFPGLTHETLELLLEFIYTGSLPPPGLEDSVHSAAACLEMEELLDALDCRRTNSSESPKHMEADENASYLESFVEAQVTGRNNKTASHCQASEWRRQSCEVVPVIRHAGDPSHNYDGCNTRRKRTGGCGKETPRFGLSAQHDGLSDATGQESVLHGTKHLKYCSVIRDTVNDKFLDTLDETPHPHAAMKEDVKTEVHIKGKSVIVNTMHSETANVCVYTVHTKAECSPLTQSNTSTEISSLRNSIDQEGTSDQEAVDTSSHSDKTSDVNSQHTLENGHLAVISQLDSKICNVTSPMLHTATVAQKILGNADGQTAVENKYNCFVEDCELSSDFSWGLEKKSSDCRQTCVQQCPKRSITPNPHPWIITANSCTENHVVSQKITKPVTFTESQHGTQRDTGLNIPDSDREKEYFFSQEKNEMLDYKGQVTYHYLHSRQREEMSNLEDEGHDGAMANVDDHAREDSRISPKHPAMDSSEIMETTEGSSNCSSAQISSIGLVGAQQYRCAVCERDFSQRGSLNRHLRSHLGVRPYSCPRCPMTFSRQYRVLEHLRVHQRSCHGFQRTGPT